MDEEANVSVISQMVELLERCMAPEYIRFITLGYSNEMTNPNELKGLVWDFFDSSVQCLEVDGLDPTPLREFDEAFDKALSDRNLRDPEIVNSQAWEVVQTKAAAALAILVRSRWYRAERSEDLRDARRRYFAI